MCRRMKKCGCSMHLASLESDDRYVRSMPPCAAARCWRWFGDVDWTNQVVMLRGETTESGRTRMPPIATLRLKAVWSGCGSDEANETKGEEVAVFSNAAGNARCERLRQAGFGIRI